MKTLIQSLTLTLTLAMAPTLAFGEFDHSHKAFNEILKKYVTQKGAATTVDYKNLKQNRKPLKDYLATLSAVKKAEYKAWSDAQRLSFLINAYNAFTIELILNNYPLESIRDLGGLFSSPWKKRFFTLLEKEQHLDGIEHETIRKEFAEPRIHFAVNCASIGCPALATTAFVADKLNDQLETATRLFLADTTRNRYDSAKKKLYLSKIFDWYDEDFEKASGSVEAYVADYVTQNEADRALIKKKKVDVDHLDYDWGLNETK